MKASKPFACQGCQLMLVLVVAVLVMAVGASQPADTGLVIRERDVKDHPELSGFRWPTSEQMKTALVPEAVSTPAGVVALDWIRKVIRPGALPKHLRDSFVGLRGYVHGYDAGLIKYETDGFLVQIVIRSALMRVFLRGTTPTKRVGKEAMLRLVQGVIKRFFNESAALLETELTLVEKEGTLRGVNARLSDPEAMRKLRSWTQMVEWWTNGELVWVSLGLNPGAAGGGRKDWFSHTYRKKRLPDTTED